MANPGVSQRFLCFQALVILLGTGWLAGFSRAHADDWQKVQVPGLRQTTEAPGTDGVAWYRTWVKVDRSFFTRHERNLFEESVGVNIHELEGAYEFWVNGKKLGTGGSFPPDYKSERAKIHRHKIPVGTLQKDLWNEIAIRVYTPPAAKPGFHGDAPFIMNYFVECIFEGVWEYRAGQDYQPGVALKEKPATSAFDVFRESNRVLGRAQQVHGPKLPPVESASKITPDADFAVDLLLNEPQIAQPFHFSFDSRGRLWVAQYRQYPYPAGLKMISRDRYYRSHYDKVPPAPPMHDRGMDIISIHEDTDGRRPVRQAQGLSGRPEHGQRRDSGSRRRVGDAHALPAVLSRCGLRRRARRIRPLSTCRASVWKTRTRCQRSGVGHGRLAVWRPGQHHHLPCHAAGHRSRRTRRVSTFKGCMVWRYHPITHRFEIFSEGGGNNFGLEIDSGGRLFTGNNGGQTRGWHYMQGGLHLMQGTTPNKFGPVRNPFAFGELPTHGERTGYSAVHAFRHAGRSTAMPQTYTGNRFSAWSRCTTS